MCGDADRGESMLVALRGSGLERPLQPRSMATESAAAEHLPGGSATTGSE
jgi:hypothetical protein